MLELFERESGFITPKVATRAAVFDGGRIMLVRELRDDLWVLPGGYCDLNEPPSQAAAREVLEETGFAVRPTRLLAVYDRKRTPETIRWTHFYTMFFDCESLGQVAAPKELETSAMGFFGLEDLPPLNPNQTVEQLERVFELHRDPELAAGLRLEQVGLDGIEDELVSVMIRALVKRRTRMPRVCNSSVRSWS